MPASNDFSSESGGDSRHFVEHHHGALPQLGVVDLLVAHRLVGEHGILAVERGKEAVRLSVVNHGDRAVLRYFVGEEEVVVKGDGRVLDAYASAVGAGLVDAVGQVAVGIAPGGDI